MLRIFLIFTFILLGGCKGQIDFTNNSSNRRDVGAGSTTGPIDTSALGAAPGSEEWIIVPANAGGMGLTLLQL